MPATFEEIAEMGSLKIPVVRFEGEVKPLEDEEIVEREATARELASFFGQAGAMAASRMQNAKRMLYTELRNNSNSRTLEQCGDEFVGASGISFIQTLFNNSSYVYYWEGDFNALFEEYVLPKIIRLFRNNNFAADSPQTSENGANGEGEDNVNTILHIIAKDWGFLPADEMPLPVVRRLGFLVNNSFAIVMCVLISETGPLSGCVITYGGDEVLRVAIAWGDWVKKIREHLGV